MCDKSWVIPYIQKFKTKGKFRNIKLCYDEIENHIPKYLYKYFSFENDYLLNNLKNDIIYFSKPNQFNDPFDSHFGYNNVRDNFYNSIDNDINFSMKETFDECFNILHNFMYKSINKIISISCFCESHQNILMWSHYANKHTGVCVEYDLSKMSKLLTTNLFPIIYNDYRIDNSEVIGSDVIEIANLYKALINKSNIWEYENEWRIILPSQYIENNCIKQQCISKIYCGAKISKENKDKIIKLIDEKNNNYENMNKIEIEYYELDRSEYKLKLI